MANVDTSELRRLVGPVYLIAGLLVVIPIVDLLSNMVPFRLDDPFWRYGSMGLGAGFMLTPMLGVVLAVLLAGLMGHWKVGRSLGWLNLVLGSLLVPATALFLLDAIQVRNGVQPDALRTFDIGVAKAVIKLLLGAVAFGWLGLRGVQARARPDRVQEGAALIRTPS